MDDPLNQINHAGSVEITLLDAMSGRPLMSWSFESLTEITIGRAPDQLIELKDPYISRQHACLNFKHGAWILTSKGMNGVYVNNEKIIDYDVDQEVIFRLGNEGPMLKFVICKRQNNTDDDPAAGTISITNMQQNFSDQTQPGYKIDQEKLQHDVQEIVDNDYFQRLKMMIGKIKKPQKD